MKKKYIILVLILIILSFFGVINPVKGFSYNLISLETNKDLFFIDEDIKFNSSWELNYNIDNEEAYIQIHIMDAFEQIIWNSSKYKNIGTFKKNWTVNIEELNSDFSNSSFILYIKFFLFYFHIENMNTIRTYLETIKITVIKRNLTCQLIGYKAHIKLGELLSFNAFFFDENSGSAQYLNNQTINFMISFNDLIIHQCNYTTNNSGAINIHLSSLTNLRLGQNFLIFSIKNNLIFNDSKFIFGLFVEKNQLNIEIMNFKSNLKESEDLEVKLYCYYSVNQMEMPLISYNLLVKIFDNKTVIFINEYRTDEHGVLYFLISQELFSYNENNQELILSIFFNGTDSIDNKTLSLSFNINQDPFSKLLKSFQMKFLSFSSVLIVLFILLSYVIINKKSKSEKLLSELVIRY